MRSLYFSSTINSRHNSSRLVYNLGSEAGFFSEYNNMVLAILYCLDNGLNFSLFSKNANFRTENGWADFFLPFCQEETAIWHSWLNKRPYDSYKIPGLKTVENVLIGLCKKAHPDIVLMSEVWAQMRNQSLEKTFSITSLGLSGNLRTVCRELIRLTWNYNSAVKQECQFLSDKLNLPERYIGLHIRGGDKFIEASRQEEGKYINKAVSLTDCRNAFVLTDDFSVIERLQKNYPEWIFYTLCKESERGYFHKEFNKQDRHTKAKKLVRLFASVDIISESELFIGTFSSNPGMYLGMRMEPRKTFSVDVPEWCIW